MLHNQNRKEVFKMKALTVLSLFDGISCGQVAFERANIPVKTYYASEVDKRAIKAPLKHYPKTVQIGDVKKVRYNNGLLETENGSFYVGEIDVIIGGSPCQDLSAYKKNKGEAHGLTGTKSELFYHFERILKEVNPKFFLLENVLMDKEWENIITELLQVEPFKIDSALVAAAHRQRNYWTNIPFNGVIEEKEVLIKDIVQPCDTVPQKYWYEIPFIYNGDDKKVQATLIKDKGLQRNMKEVYNLNVKCNTLLADGDGGNRQKKVFQNGRCRKFTPLEYERMQTLPDNYTAMLSDSARYTTVGNGWTIDVIVEIFNGLKEVF